MPVSTPYRTTPQLGPQLDEIFTSLPYYDTQLGVSNGAQAAGTVEPSYRLLNKETGNDDADYVWTKAASTIAATATTGTNVIVSANGTSAAGAGGWWAPVAGVASGAWYHARSKAWNVF